MSKFKSVRSLHLRALGLPSHPHAGAPLSSSRALETMSITKPELRRAPEAAQSSDDKRPPPNYGACSTPTSPAGKPRPRGDHYEGPIEHALHSLLTHFADAPEYNQDNPDILTGYRRPTDSWWTCLRTVGGWHNESLNVSRWGSELRRPR